MLSYRERQRMIEEQRLRAKLAEPPPPSRASFWKVLNAPITLWLLSTVAIGVISATITQQQACSKDFEKDSLDFRQLSDEIPGRNKLLFHKLAETRNEADYDKQIEQFNSGEAFYVYSEYKGKSIIELSSMRANLAKKLSARWIGSNLMVCRIELQETVSDMRMKSKKCEGTLDVPKVDVESGPRYGQDDRASPFDWGIPPLRGFGVVDQVVYFDYLKSNAFKAFLAYDTPRAYLDMGEYWEISGNCSLKRIWSNLLGF